MIKKIKRRFILLSMLPLLLVMLAVVVAMNAVNFAAFIKDADDATESIAFSDAIFSSSSSVLDGVEIKPPKNHNSPMVRDARYFIVKYGFDGSVSSCLIRGLDELTSDEAISLAAEALDGEETGFIGSYRYRITDRGKYKLATFLDCSHRIDMIGDFAISSLLVSAVAYFAVFLVFVALADRIIKPFKETYEKQKQFITDAGHEIKTPLTIINANLDLCEMEHGENEYTAEIRAQLENMKELTGSLVFLAKMEESGDIPMVELALSDIVDETVASFTAPAQLENKRIVTKIAPMLSINGNDRAIREMVCILMDNALKYSPSDSEIAVTLTRHARSVTLSVKNVSEQPIDKESLSKLFLRFWRADSSRNSSTGGHGIGLSVAAAVTEKHGGKISAEADGDSLVISAVFPAI